MRWSHFTDGNACRLKKRGRIRHLSPADSSEHGSVQRGVVDLLVEVLHGREELVLVPRLHEHRLVLLDPVPDVVPLQQNNRFIEKLGSGNSTRCLGCERTPRSHVRNFCILLCESKKFKQILLQKERFKCPHHLLVYPPQNLHSQTDKVPTFV